MVRFYWNLKPNISICLPIIKEYKIGLVVYCDVWDNHCYTRSHVKSFSKLKKFVRISKCPLQKWRSDNKYKLWGQPFRINNIFMMHDWYEVVIMDIGFPHYYHPEFRLSLLLSITGDSAETWSYDKLTIIQVD